VRDRSLSFSGPVKVVLVVDRLVLESPCRGDVVAAQLRVRRLRAALLQFEVVTEAAVEEDPLAVPSMTAALDAGRDAALPVYPAVVPSPPAPGRVRRHPRRRGLLAGAVVAGLVLLAIWQHPGSTQPNSTARPKPILATGADNGGVVDQSSPSLHAAGVEPADRSEALLTDDAAGPSSSTTAP
jgi:hypothetical protein